MTAADLDFVEALAAELYPDHPESRAAFVAKLATAPDACFVADGPEGPAGYCVALWSAQGRPPKLDEPDYVPPARDSLHLHDIAVAPAARGQGLVADALEQLGRVAAGAPLSLVAVHGTQPLWELHGFVPATANADVLATYGSDAVYMIRPA
jgi:ribosomal protein S18 acetylase RimI-like enzyme